MSVHTLGNKHMVVLFVAALCVMILAGCGGSSAQPGPAAGPAPDEVLAGQFGQPAAPAAQAPSNTTSAFGIPAGLTGSVDAGQVVFSNNCAACHSSMSPRNYSQLVSAMSSIGAMRSIQLSDQQLADLTAYLNRNSIPPQDPGPPPSGQPAPPDPPAASPPPDGGGGMDDDVIGDDDDGDGDELEDDESMDDDGDDLLDDDEGDDDGSGADVDDDDGAAGDDDDGTDIDDDEGEDDEGDGDEGDDD